MGGHRTIAVLCATAFAAGVMHAQCGVAFGGTLHVQHDVFVDHLPRGDVEHRVGRVIYTADPGETNDVTMTGSVGTIGVHDSGAPVKAGPECEQLGEHDARCSPTEESVVGQADTGDGADRVHLVNSRESMTPLGADGGPGADQLTGGQGGSSLDGGPGDDVITGGDFTNTLHGGPGDDTIVGGSGLDDMYGGPGSDKLTGGGGDDLLRGDGDGAPPGADSIDGGEGVDTVIYTDRSIGVNVDLERPDGNGQAGENDRIVGVEDVVGGGGSDRLAGDAGRNFLTGQNYGPIFSDTHFARAVRGERDVLIGRRGGDVLEGSPGNDVLLAGPGNDGLGGGGGRDRYFAGPGDDLVDLEDGRFSALSCGSGHDYLESVIRTDVIPAACDTVAVDDLDVSTRVRRVGGAVLIPVFQRPVDEFPACRARIRLVAPRGPRGHRPSFGLGVVRLHAGHRQNARIVLTARGRRALSSGHRARFEVQVRGLELCNPRSNLIDSPIGAFTLAVKLAS